jgi:pyruvate-ferredoxin/flavodoxin oxidoreductase
VANATGCSSIWGGSAPSTPYTVNHKGQGPAWENSLFEDAAEFGYGMNLAVTQRRAKLISTVETLAGLEFADEDIVNACKAWLEAKDSPEASRKTGDALVALIQDFFAHQDLTGTPFEEQWLANGKKCGCPACTAAREILEMSDLLTKKSMWIFGGDGFAYDIGYGGLDHVLASRENVNVFIFDTEVYSNTGGQSSKSTPTGAVAQFAAAGKATKKKDMASIFMQYGYVYVAQVAMGANMNQTLQAIREAEAYDGPSIIIAYAPCINHGLKKKGGMANAMSEMKAAVAAGYWHLFRFNPALAEQGKNPFTMDSKAPSEDFQSFLMGETRYASLKLSFPERAEQLYARAQEEAEKKYEHFEKMAKQ